MMLQVERSPSIAAHEDHGQGPWPASNNFDLEYYWAFLRRQLPVMAFVLTVVLALGTVFLFTAAPRFTSTAELIIDSKKPTLFQTQSPLGVDLPVDSAMIDSQVEILKGEKIALAVVKDLRLTEDPEFVGPGTGLLGTIMSSISGIFGSADAKSEFELTRGALGRLQDRLTIKRIGLTYVIEIGFQSNNPQRASQVANALADAYIVDSLESKYQATRRAGSWLQDRLKELRAQATAADHAVVDFKAKNNIIDTGGRLLNEQQLADLNSALSQARGQMAEAQARQDRILSILGNDDSKFSVEVTATVTDALHNEVITRLRQQYLDLAARESDWSARYGINHMAAVNLRNQMREIRRSIYDELRRTAEGYKSDTEIAKSRVESIQKSLDEIVSSSNDTNQAQITLRDLDSTAQSYRALADNFLQLYMQSVQQQSFPITEARLITEASPPLQKSYPKAFLVLGFAFAAGSVLALGVGMLRDLSDRVFRTTRQVETLLQASCIALVPSVKGAAKAPAVQQTSIIGPRTIVRDNTLLWQAVDAPLSRFAEAIRSIKVAADLMALSRPNKVIALTSSLPNEGKSTIASNLAQLVAKSGARTILVDGDLRNPSLTRHLAPGAPSGLLEVISGKASLDDVLWSDPVTNLAFLPAVVTSRLAHSSDILASIATRKLFDQLRERFDYLIVDFSPLAPIVDVRTTSNLVDSYVYVVEWGRTKINVVEHTLGDAPQIYESLVGVVLNKADVNVMGRYDSYRGNYYYNNYYSRYGYTD